MLSDAERISVTQHTMVSTFIFATEQLNSAGFGMFTLPVVTNTASIFLYTRDSKGDCMHVTLHYPPR